MCMCVLYKVGNRLFVNITNACPCDCIFCIRKFAEGYGDAENLWLEREPTVDEVKTAFDEYIANHDAVDSHDLGGSNSIQGSNDSVDSQGSIEEIVFCGFGEPMHRANDVITLAEYFKKSGKPVRLNTNGLVRLMHPDFDIATLSVFDTVSVSLNADDEEEYNRITQPRFKKTDANPFQEVLRLLADARAYTKVAATVVGVLSPERIENCRKIADDLGIDFRVR